MVSSNGDTGPVGILPLVWYVVIVAAPRALTATLDDTALPPPLFPSMEISSPLSSSCRLSHLYFCGSHGTCDVGFSASGDETDSSTTTIHHRRVVGAHLEHRMCHLRIYAQSTSSFLLYRSFGEKRRKHGEGESEMNGGAAIESKSTAISTHVTLTNLQSIGEGSSSSPNILKIYDAQLAKNQRRISITN
ncbi:unnamed protein product [Arabis nemorensis]|uniref:Uncharacterized protein n=1 Tax=Arabis nemorensis TaxID=586526 RepID=A0A565C0Z1_9BRAS|nr:unnamed protein product [Arabis nemorensis]